MLRTADGKTEVAWVPRHQLSHAMMVFEGFLADGLKQDETLDVENLLTELVKGEARLGVIYAVDPFTPLGAWVSDLRIDDSGKTFATIYGLGGRGPNKWGSAVGELVGKYAVDNECYSYRWYGRLGWIKFVKGIKLLEAVDNRVGLFEKVVAQ